MAESAFAPELVMVEEVAGKPDKWRLCADLRYDRAPGGARAESECYVVKKDFLTDFASIPSPFAWTVPRYGEHTKAAIVHDRLCLSKVDRFAADEVFRDALRDSGVSIPRRWLLWTGVTWGSVGAVVRAVALGSHPSPSDDRVPGAPSSARPDAGCVDLGHPVVSPASATGARVRGSLAFALLLCAALALVSLSLSPGDWLHWPSYADQWWARILVVAYLLALVMAVALAACAVALWRLGLLFHGKLPGAWLVSTVAIPLVPIALGAFLAALAYGLAGPVWGRLGALAKPTLRPARAQSPSFQRAERARANFIR